jgi:FkbM family methyltransferase
MGNQGEHMVTVRLEEGRGAASPLGTVSVFQIDAPADVIWDAFVRYEAIVFTAPLATAQQGRGTVRLFAESPGAYQLHVTWSRTSGERGVALCPFTIVAGNPVSLAPQRVRVDNKYDVWAPTGWDAMHVNQYERSALASVARHVRPGAAAYDVGANLGLYTMPLLQLVGQTGVVYSFELNPVCVQFLQATVRGAGHTNCSIFPVALGDADGTLEATINYGSTALGITSESAFFAAKLGCRVTVPCVRLDHVVEQFSTRPPDFIKVDVEGAEAMVVAGMEGTLARHRPVLLLELHGRGAAQGTLVRLDRFGYTIEDLESSRRAEDSVSFLNGLPDRPVQVLCLPR